MYGIPGIVVSSATFVIVGMAALGLGADSRRIGFRLPWVSSTPQTWISGHRAAFIVVGPTSAVATVVYLVTASPDVAQRLPSGLGWSFWIAGVIVGGVIAVQRARYVLRRQPAPKILT